MKIGQSENPFDGQKGLFNFPAIFVAHDDFTRGQTVSLQAIGKIASRGVSQSQGTHPIEGIGWFRRFP